jgi:L-iditol 2-dehydrogenase
MKALVWKENGQVELELDWPEAQCSQGELVIEIKAAGICMTDIHMITGKLDFAKPPWVLGHEMSGIVARVGTDVQGWRIGDRVIVDPVVTCGSCNYCLTGKKYLCSGGGELGTTCGNGGYGEFVTVKPSNLYRLPDELSYAEGAMMEPLNCTLGAIDRVPYMAGSHVMILGPGPAGLLFVQLSKAYGALSVTLVGRNDERLELGRQLGADRTINIKDIPLDEALDEALFDVAIEASGSENGVADCFTQVTKGGTVVLYGLHGTGKPTVDTDTIISKDLMVVTCISAPLLWVKGIKLVQSGKINLSKMITAVVPFDEAQAVIHSIAYEDYRPIKAIIEYPGANSERNLQ